jgi:hypothetical protein
MTGGIDQEAHGGGRRMDNNMISRVNSQKSLSREKKSSVEAGGDDIEGFGKMLEERTSKLDRETKETANEEIYSEKKEKEKTEEAERLKRMKTNLDGRTMGMKEMLFSLGMKDPDSLSISQKMAIGINAEGSNLGAEEFQSLMSSRNLNLSDLSLHDLAALMQRSSKTQITAFLDHLAKEKARGAGEAAAPGMTMMGEGKTSVNEGETKAAKDAETSDAQRNVKREEVIKQIIQHVELRNIGNRTELTLKLNPEYLGDMKLKLMFSGDKVTAEFNTVSPLVREAIEESRGELMEALGKRGIKVGKVNVNLVEKLV